MIPNVALVLAIVACIGVVALSHAIGDIGEILNALTRRNARDVDTPFGTVTLPAPHPTLPRIDVIGDDGKVYTGTPAPAPVERTLPAGVYPLALIKVPPASSGTRRARAWPPTHTTTD